MPIIWDLFAVFFADSTMVTIWEKMFGTFPSKTANRSYVILPGLHWIGDSAACFFSCDAKNQVTSDEKGGVLWNSKENSFPKKVTLIQVGFGSFGI